MNQVDSLQNRAFFQGTEWLAKLPDSSKLETISYIASTSTNADIVVRFPAPILRDAVVLGPQVSAAANDLSVQLLTVPNVPLSPMHGIDPELLALIQQWMNSDSKDSRSTGWADDLAPLWMQFQGTQIVWSPNKIAILATPETLPSIRAVIVQFAFYDLLLRELEKGLAEAWPQLEADMPTAFESDNRTMAQTKELRQRFLQALQFRSKLAQISPQVYAPHTYPPTLASQIGERIRERTRMEYRHEYLDEQLELFENVYELSGQKNSDTQIANFGYMLEWIIIVLLVTQLLLSGFEMLTTVSA